MRRVLFLDAATCLATGLLLSLFAAPLAGLFGLPASLLLYAGLALFPIAAFMAAIALARVTPRWGIWIVILGNVAWVVASLAVLFVTVPSMLGHVFVIAQAAAVAVLAAAEYRYAVS
jgi:hypothetical protein